MPIEISDYYKDIISIIKNNVVSPAKNNSLFTNKAYLIGNNILSIVLDLTARTLTIIRHDG